MTVVAAKGTGPLGLIGVAARLLDAATPPDRERAVDGLRAVAICGVVLGHWLVTATVLWGDGGLRISSPLRALPELAAATWLFQALTLFFLVGGYVSARGLERSRARGEADRAWLRARLLRLGRPVLAVAAVWGAAAPVLLAAGVPEASVRSALLLVLQPLWFIGVYAAATALTPWLLAAERRLGPAAALAAVLLTAGVDLLRFGPWSGQVPEWAGLANVLPAWFFGYLLGISWARGRLRRPFAAALLAGGAVLLAVLVTRLGYPVSAVGVPGMERSNSNPPSLFVPALGAVQAGAAVLLAAPLERLLHRPLVWACAVRPNLNALTLFCWHQTALLAVALPASALPVPLPGLTSAVDGAAWLGARLLWLPVLAAVLAALCAALRRFEPPWTGLAATLPGRTAAALGAAACVGTAVLLV
ncbi:acyltransferase family protein [Nocardiopsis potens]|uniref:acyltransferase family protein n=1 Tax=Nocardiopsis potens TaxID=1246458 RepID=UPI001F4D21C4|nr:acyltransferase family protein [Nocardiopsis potens]